MFLKKRQLHNRRETDLTELPRLLKVLLGMFFLVIPLIVPPPAGMPVEAWKVTGVTFLMAAWWVTEVIPIAATAFVPLAVFPLIGVAGIAEVATPYANPLVYMMMGGFMIGLAMQRSNLHRRIALAVLSVAGRRPDSLVAGFMVATALLSMWVSNTATAAMMTPIGMSVTGMLKQDRKLQQNEKVALNLPIALMLGIAFSASIGGIGTLVGTPPNAVLAGFVNEHTDMEISFTHWLVLGIPTAAVLLVLAWVILTRIVFPVGHANLEGVRKLLEEEREALGPVSTAEKRVATIFVFTATAWTLRPLVVDLLPQGVNFTDAGIAMIAALSLFISPEDRRYHGVLLDWAATRDLPWNVMVLIGGGLSLGTMVQASGLAGWVGDMLANLDALPLIAVATLSALLAMMVSHVTSNTATASTIVPLAVSLAVAIGAPPLMLAIPVAMGCSCSFMMPVATPPNAIVYGSGIITVGQMAKAGALVGIVSLAVITVVTFTIGEWAFG